MRRSRGLRCVTGGEPVGCSHARPGAERDCLRRPGGERRVGRPPGHHHSHRHRLHRHDGHRGQLSGDSGRLHVIQAALRHQPLYRLLGRRRPHGGASRPALQRHLGSLQGNLYIYLGENA